MGLSFGISVDGVKDGNALRLDDGISEGEEDGLSDDGMSEGEGSFTWLG